MDIKVSTWEKKQFIQTLLTDYHFHMREVKWILSYVLKQNSLLKNIHFVSDIRYCTRSIILSTQGTGHEPFYFIKGNVKTRNPQMAYHDLRLNENEDLYVKVNLTGISNKSLYYLVLEDNPFLLNYNDSEETMDLILLNKNERYFQKKIDKALDEGDYKMFIHYSNELKKLLN